MERGDLRINKETLNLNEFVLHLMNDLEGMLKTGQKIIHRHEGSLKIEQDRRMLSHVISNLLSNAIKYSDTDIELQTLVNKQNLIMTIKDYGIGIPEEDQQHLFQRFFRAKNVEHLQGTGLGLSIVERYLDLLEGTIEFESSLGKGSTFTITLPR